MIRVAFDPVMHAPATSQTASPWAIAVTSSSLLVLYPMCRSSFYVHGWQLGGTLEFEFDTLVGVPAMHDRFVEQLIDPTWGLPLTIREKYCYCSDPTTQNYQCWFELGHFNGGENVLQLRFSWTKTRHLGDWRCWLKTVGAQQS
ncbi:hypothetical protein [Nocardia sp. CA-135398]|uniref:hypothetical protein n=1 Tax=Nocardia sp. CA-135398 TaxID=3239977 RepID=UPI003D96CA78